MKRLYFIFCLVLLAGCATTPASERPLVATSRGPYEVATSKTNFLDSRRGRDIPVRLYLPQNAPGRRAVVVFSHGLANGADGNRYLGEHWASHGFVAVHLQHHGSDIDLVRDKGLLALFHSTKDRKHWRDRPEDVTFILDRLEAIERGEEADPFSTPVKGRIDLDRLVAAGHSYGAFTAVALAGFLVDLKEEGGVTNFRDERVDAAIMISMPKLDGATPQAWGGVKTPGLHITGTRDRTLLFRTFLRHRRIPFEQIGAADQTLIVMDGATHSTFSDDERRISRRHPEYIRATADATTMFLKAVLDRDAGADEAYRTLNFPGLATVERR